MFDFLSSQGGKFSVIPLFLNLGSGLALLGIVSIQLTLTFYFIVLFTVQCVLVPFTCDQTFFSGEREIYNISFLLQATVLCDIVVLYVLQKKYFYREKKYLLVDDTESESDDFQVC